MVDAKEYEKGEKPWIGVQVTERDDGNVTATGVFEVFDVDGKSVQSEGAASITGSGTATVYAEGIVDTTASDFTSGEAYEVRFKVTIGTALRFGKRHIKLKERRL